LTDVERESIARYVLAEDFLEKEQREFTLWKRYRKVNGVGEELETHADLPDLSWKEEL